MTYAPGWDCDMRCVRSPAHLRPRTRAHKLAFTPRIVIDTNSPAHAESSPHVRRTLDINRESDIHAVAGTLQTPISIHALRKESDPGTLRLTKRSKNFNPHSPCGERRPIWICVAAPSRYFNPHSPCGERLHTTFDSKVLSLFQSTLPLRRATRGFVHDAIRDEISIHTPLAGSDQAAQARLASKRISIHTPLAESDFTPFSGAGFSFYFNPRSP